MTSRFDAVPQLRSRLGPLGRNLLVAFVLVALGAVVVVAAAAFVGSARGIDVSDLAHREELAAAVADELGTAYAHAGSWSRAELSDAARLASSGGATLSVKDAGGAIVLGRGMGMGMGHGTGSGRSLVSAAVVVDGVNVGEARLAFGTGSTASAQSVAWTWIGAAALLAVALATIIAVLVARRLTYPLARMAAVARHIAAGDRAVRPGRRDLDDPTEIGDLARAVDAALTDVERSESVRRQMTADVAHELRTPLAVLRASLEELRDGFVPADAERLQTLYDQVLRLNRIVDDLAELTSAEAAALSLRRQDVDVSKIVFEAARSARPSLNAAGIALIHPDSSRALVAFVDPDRLHQALSNVLSNAARHCRPGDRVTVDVGQTPEAIRITISDDGPGIAAADLPHVFDRLWRGSANVGGSGIGLAIVREIVQAHGGSVDVESEFGAGSTFRLWLPRVELAHQHEG